MHEATAAASWAAVVWGQFCRRRLAVAALWGVALLFALAALAPLIASSQPLWWRSAAGWSAPALTGLYDRKVFPFAVDLIFNALLFPGSLVVAVAALVMWTGRRAPRAVRRRVGRRAIGAALSAWTLVVVGLLAVPTQSPDRDYRAEAAALEAAGAPVQVVFAPVAWSPRDTVLADKLAGPSRGHPLGTDNEGRDTFARLLYGTRISLTIGVFAVAAYCLLGVGVGALAGYFGGWVDLAIVAVVEVVMCIPPMFLVLGAAAFIPDPSIFHIMGIIAAVSWTTPARLTRAEFLKLRGLDFVVAAEAVGYPRRTIIFREILPNALGPVLVTATFGIASAILVESGMSFLGLGAFGAPSWGTMLATGRTEEAWMLILAPGFAILVTVSLLNLVGEGVRDALDPRQRR